MCDAARLAAAFRSATWLAFTLAICIFGTSATLAQSPLAIDQGAVAAPPSTPLPEDLSRAEFDALLGRLSDEQARALLVDWYASRAAAQPATPAPSEGWLAASRRVADRLSARLEEMATDAPRLPQEIGVALERVQAFGGVGFAAFGLAAALAAGFAARHFWRRNASARQQELAARNAHLGPYATVGVIADATLFLVIELIGVAVFWVAAMAALYLSIGDADARLVVSSFIAATASLLIAHAALELLFPSGWAIYRIIPLDDGATARFKTLALIAAGIQSFGFPIVGLVGELGGAGRVLDILIVANATAFTLVAVVALALLGRDLARAGPRPGSPTPSGALSWLSANWSALAIGYCLLLWAVSVGSILTADADRATGTPAHESLLLILGLVIGNLILGHYLFAQEGLDPRLANAIRRSARLLSLVVGAAVFLSLWGVEPSALNASGVGGWILRALVDVATTALIGYVLWDLIRTAIDTRLAAEIAPAGEGDASDHEGGLGVSRAATLLPLFRSFALAAVAITCLFTAAASLGVNVAPLIAGAGVLGIAIGFGAQTLVRDIVSGVFFLIDDAFRRGEYVEIGPVRGTVEKISIRSLQLRHHLGPVHTIPFGEIQTLTNYSRDWVIMKLPLRLTFDTDPDAVKKIIKRIAAEMEADPELGPKLQEPPKSQGVIQMEDSAMILRVKFKATPGDQFVLRRELLHRIRAAFEEVGIRFASREVTVRVSGDPEPSSATARQAAGAAARRELDRDSEEAMAGSDTADDR